MSSDQADHDPFRDPTIPSLAQALDTFRTLPEETSSRKARVRTAARTFGRLVGKELAKIPAQPNYVMREFARFKKQPIKLDPKSIANCKSEIRYLLEKCGTPTGRSRFRDLLPEWEALRDEIEGRAEPDQLGEKPLFWKVSRLAAFSSGLGVLPTEVNDELIQRYRDALDASGEVADTDAKVRDAIRAWNKISSGSGPPLPALFLAPRHVPRWTIEPIRFSQGFQDSVDEWLADMSHVDPDAEEGRTRALRQTSINSYRHSAFKAASGLVFSGRAIETVTSLACLVEIDAFKAIMKELRERQGDKTSTALHGLGMVLVGIARNWEKLGDAYLARLSRLCANHKPEDCPTKSQTRLDAFEDEKLLSQLLHLPKVLLEEAAEKKTSPRTAQTLAEVAVALETEWHAPFRVKNLATLQMHKNIQPINVRGQPRWLIRLPRAETKNWTPLVFEIPTESLRLIESAFKFYEQPDGYLFPGPGGGHKTSAWLSRQIKQVVEKRLGVPFHTHMMRGLVATLLVKESGGLEHARAALGDSTDRVVRKNYTANAEIHLIRNAQETIRRTRIRTAPMVPSSHEPKKAA